jgi:hypothetical protein
MPRLPRWVWVLVAIVLAVMAAYYYVGMRSFSTASRGVEMKRESQEPQAEKRQPQSGRKRFGGGVIRQHSEPGEKE